MKPQGRFTMNNLLDLSGKISPARLAFFGTLNDIAAACGIGFFVVGATARDLILEVGHGRPSRRATLDVDVAVRVGVWDEFEKLKESLLRSGEFTPTQRVERLRFRNELLIDLLPFGGVADAHGEIRWPPHGAVVMSVAGFEEAHDAAQLVRVRKNPPLDIRVASPAGLAILKLVAWSDRPVERGRDARDLAHILDVYLDAGNNARLFEEHMDLVDVESFDYVLAGARLLGRDIAGIGGPETVRKLREVLTTETAEGERYRLVGAMVADSIADEGARESSFEAKLAVLRALQAGIEDGKKDAWRSEGGEPG